MTTDRLSELERQMTDEVLPVVREMGALVHNVKQVGRHLNRWGTVLLIALAGSGVISGPVGKVLSAIASQIGSH